MSALFSPPDWERMFRLSLPFLEIVIRGSAMYWFLFAVFRFVVRRDVGSVGVADILVLVIVADAAQNAMAGEYTSVSDGMVLVATLIGWNLLLDWLSFRFRAVRRFAEPPPLRLVQNGKMLKQNMRREFLTEDELWAKLREAGVDSLDQVKEAFIESDGQVSVIKKRR
ncbi:MAG TPA: YetF domain-containing protein [Noviherbaspirillum sp.]|nr:YetF domain-containing protein [Noviherbaspirillum sp.]